MTAGEIQADSSSLQAFVARQPIFDRSLQIYAYELLFRSGINSVIANVSDGDKASDQVVSDSILTIGMDSLTGGNRAFINFTENGILGKTPTLLPPDCSVIEILEDVSPTPEILAACARLKSEGYTLAIDDVENPDDIMPFVDLVDIIKVDLPLSTPEARKICVDRFKPMGKLLLAEKVETKEEFDSVMEMGYDLFQGFFFSKPKIVSHNRITSANPSRMALLQAVHKRDVEFKTLEDIIKKDVGLSFRLLKYINSSFFGLKERVKSIRQALTLLGQKNIRRWISLIAIESIGEDKPGELITDSLIRAGFCERLAAPLSMHKRQEDLFLLGILSLIDAILDRPMSAILDEIPIDEDIRAALLEEPNQLRQALDVAVSYQRGNWLLFAALRDQIGFNEDLIPELYVKSVQYAEEICREYQTT